MSGSRAEAAPAGRPAGGALMPVDALATLARLVEAGEVAGGESPEAAAAAEATLGELRTAWPTLDAGDRVLLGELVNGLLARREDTGAVGWEAGGDPWADTATPAGEPLPAVLARLGVRRLRPGQDRAIAAALGGRDAVVVMATGSGKSLCYQAPAAALSGLTVVVSPLIALMADQLGALQRAGIPAAVLNSSGSEEDARAALSGVRRGELRLLYVAPERFHSAAFLRAMDEARIALLVVDEAHCVSEWGHDFRPDYRRVGAFRARLRPRATLALTATATPRVRVDIMRNLGLDRPVEVMGGFDRPNLVFDALWVEGKGSTRRKRAALLGALRSAGEGKTIVYTGTRRAAEDTAAMLGAEGYAAVPYHAGRGDRAAAQEAFATGRAQVVTATNAFGMGVNVPDVRLVVHTALPDSLEQLYQEAGRAGRDGLAARHVVVAGPADEVTVRRRISQARMDAGEVERLLGRLAATAVADGGFALARGALDDRDLFALTMAERSGALVVEGAPGGGRRGRLTGDRLTPEQREELDGQVRAELRRRHRGLDAAVAYVRDPACRRAAFLRHFQDPADPAPEERCCDHCSAPGDLADASGAPSAIGRSGAPAAEPREGLAVEARGTYDALRAWRAEVAKELGWPAFRIASNRTLVGIAEAAPEGEAALARVRGVGPWLMEAHAARILAIVAGGESPSG